MKKACISFDIGVRNVHAVLGQAEGTNVKILRSALRPLPKGVISDGLITNMELLSQAMQEAIIELGTDAKDAVVTFNSNSVISREFEVPFGTDQEVEAMIKNEILQYFGMAETDLVEYRKIGEVESDGVKKINVRAAVMNLEIARGYYDLLSGLKLNPVALDIHPNVISKVFSGQTTVNGTSTGSFILLDIGHSGTMVYVIAKGKLSFFRFINFGGRAVNRLVANTFSLPANQSESKKIEFLSIYKKVIQPEAEKKEKTETRSIPVTVKGQRFVIKKKEPEGPAPEAELVQDEALVRDEALVQDILATEAKMLTKEDALAAVKPLYGELMEELRKVIQFFTSRSGAQSIEHIFLMGKGAALYGLPEYIAQGLGYDVSKLQSISNIQFNYQEQLPGTFINAAGALIRQ